MFLELLSLILVAMYNSNKINVSKLIIHMSD